MGSIDGYVFTTIARVYNYSRAGYYRLCWCVLNTWVRPTSVDRDGLPQPYSDLGPDYSSYIFCMASGPISTSHQLILVIDIV